MKSDMGASLKGALSLVPSSLCFLVTRKQTLRSLTSSCHHDALCSTTDLQQCRKRGLKPLKL